METKKVFFTELAYVVGILTLALGTAMMERADWGVSMVVAPAYLLHLKVSQYAPWFTFGVAEYMLQAVLLVVLSLVMGRFRKSYLFSFCTAVFYGITLDVSIALVAGIPAGTTAAKLGFYGFGMLFCAVGVALLFHTYISPEAYELFVKELSRKWNKDISKVKTGYDCCSCLVGVLLSFLFFGIGRFEGVKAGTIVCALVNGWLIGRISRAMDAVFCFQDGTKQRELFER